MGDDEENVEFITKKFAKLEVEEDWTPTEDYFVHIDVVHGSSTLVSRRINKFMILNDGFDPRRAVNFPKDLMQENDVDTLALRRALSGGVSDTYYEFWKVRKDFSLPKFSEMVGKLPHDVKVRIVRVIDNDLEITIYKSLLA